MEEHSMGVLEIGGEKNSQNTYGANFHPSNRHGKHAHLQTRERGNIHMGTDLLYLPGGLRFKDSPICNIFLRTAKVAGFAGRILLMEPGIVGAEIRELGDHLISTTLAAG